MFIFKMNIIYIHSITFEKNYNVCPCIIIHTNNINYINNIENIENITYTIYLDNIIKFYRNTLCVIFTNEEFKDYVFKCVNEEVYNQLIQLILLDE